VAWKSNDCYLTEVTVRIKEVILLTTMIKT